MRRALLIQPPSSLDLDDGALPTTYTGVGILACQAFLERHGVDAIVLHLGRIRGQQARLRALREQLASKPGLVAVGMNWVHMSLGAIEVARAVRAEGYGGPIVVGGQHASMFAQAIQEGYGDCFDAVLVGDAEGALLEIAVHGLPGDRSLAHPMIIGPSARNPALDELPMISYRKVLPADDGQLAALSTVRGFCPRKCTYCLESGATRRQSSGQLRVRSSEALAEQIERFVAEGRDIITIQDPYFRTGDDEVVALLEAVRARGVRLRELNLFTEPRAYTDRGFDAIAAFPADHITVDFGVESGAPDVLRLAQRSADVETTLAEMLAAARRGILVYTWWMVGLPGETEATVRETAAYLHRTMRAGLVPRWVTPAVVFPGTPIAEDPARYGVTLHKTSFEDFFPFSTTARTPFGVYPQLITHDCAQLSGVDILRHTLSLKTLVRDNKGDLGADAQQCAEIRDALSRRTQMFTTQPDEGYDMTTFF